MENMSFISTSIVVPIYKTPEKLLRDCIESAINQTKKNIEIILIDDSPAETGEICDEYAARDKRISVYHQSKGGLSAGRNKGVEVSKGKWVTFLDSDDWLEPTTCEIAESVAEKENADIVLFGTAQEFNDRTSNFTYNIKNKTVFVGEENLWLQKEVLNNYGNIATAWAKLFRRDFLVNNNLFHNAELSQGSEGVEFNVRVFKKAERSVFISDIFYHYVYYTSSLSASFNENNYKLIFKCLQSILDEIKTQKNYEELYPIWCERVLSVLTAASVGGYFGPKLKASYKERVKRFEQMLKNDCVNEALEHPTMQSMGVARKFVLWCIKTKLYFLIIPIGKVRYWQKNR